MTKYAIPCRQNHVSTANRYQTVVIYPAYYLTRTDEQGGKYLTQVQYVEDVVALDNGQVAKVAFKEVNNMWFKSYGVRRIIGIALVACLAAAASVVSFTNTSTNRSQAPVHVFPRNANGQTYGPEVPRPGLATPGTEPDLILAIGVDGTTGYVKRTDDEGPQPKNPQEAVALDKYNLAHPTREIPLYAVDGKTVIGSFVIGGGEGFEAVPVYAADGKTVIGQRMQRIQ